MEEIMKLAELYAKENKTPQKAVEALTAAKYSEYALYTAFIAGANAYRNITK